MPSFNPKTSLGGAPPPPPPPFFWGGSLPAQLEDVQRQVATAMYENDRIQGKVPTAPVEPITPGATAQSVWSLAISRS